MSKLFAAQLGALSKFAYGPPCCSDRHLGQMMNCKLDMARMERGKEREREIDALVHVTRAAQIMRPWMRVCIGSALLSCPLSLPPSLSLTAAP